MHSGIAKKKSKAFAIAFSTTPLKLQGTSCLQINPWHTSFSPSGSSRMKHSICFSHQFSKCNILAYRHCRINVSRNPNWNHKNFVNAIRCALLNSGAVRTNTRACADASGLQAWYIELTFSKAFPACLMFIYFTILHLSYTCARLPTGAKFHCSGKMILISCNIDAFPLFWPSGQTETVLTRVLGFLVFFFGLAGDVFKRC